MKKRKTKNKNSNLFLLIILALLLRILLSSRGTHLLDFNTWIAWSDRLAAVGFKKFYQSWSDYLPGYLYILYFLGQFKNFLEPLPGDISDFLLFKFPSIAADLATGYLIYKITKSFASQKKALFASTLYLFNPAVIANSTLWGQADSFFTLLLFTSLYLLLQGNWSVSAIFFALASVTKPQGLLFAGLVPFFINKKERISQSLKFFILAGALCLISFIPFASHQNIVRFAFQRFKVALNQYPYASVNAFNLWAWLNKMRVNGRWVPDKSLFLGLSFQIWGLTLFAISYLAVIYMVLKEKKRPFRLGLKAFGLLSLACFLFLTRVHERHLFPLFAFLTPLATIDPLVLLALIFYSAFYILNLTFAHGQLIPGFHPPALSLTAVSLISFSAIAIFILLTIRFYHQSKLTFPKIRLSRIIRFFKEKRRHTLVLFLIVALSFLIRIINLAHPPEYVFDEVYYGFTAQEMAKGNTAAWEWWNSAPKGFSYEWTHPPLAKLTMALGVLIFGESQLAFRVPAAFFGTGVICLIYLLAKLIFKSERIGLLGAFLASLDGLLFVMSRIGMADIYLLFFLLATIYFVLREKDFLSGISLGLAISTKWTGVYLYPIVGIILLSRIISRFERKRLLSSLFYYFVAFLIVPSIVYFYSYILFFTSGHTFSQFKELQKQMWWYHTGLKATHSYQSAARTWPLMTRPVWLWVKYQKDKIANIYCLGNPVIWWSGLMVLPFAVYQAGRELVKRKEFKLGLVIFCYLAFWLPWIFSPRIMFLYHYLPAVPFLCILIAWALGKIKSQKSKVKSWRRWGNVLVACYLLVIMMTFFLFYPIYTGLLVSKKYFEFLLWFPSWR